jgi:hypothetical protein
MLIFGLFKSSSVYHMTDTWCGYEVPGMILLSDLKGAMRLDCSKVMSASTL